MPAISYWIMTLTKIQNWGDHMKDIVLSCDNLLKQYPVKKGMFNKVVGQKNIVDHVSLELEKGKTLAIVGESGCGKTVLTRVLLGIEDKTDGSIVFEGKSVDDMTPQEKSDMKAKIQMIFQDTLGSLHPRMSIRESLEEPLILNGVKDKEEREKIILDTLSQVGMAPMFLDRYPHQLSGGQRQRVAMGRAIVRNPKVFLMDEPLSNLDAKLRVQMRSEIASLHNRLKATIIYVTHDQTEAMTLGTRIVVLKDGVIMQVDSPQKLYNEPNNLFVAGFIGSPQMNFIDAVCKVEGERVTLNFEKTSVVLPPAKAKKLIDGGYNGKTVVMGIRPEDIHDEESFIEMSPDSAFKTTIRIYELLGAEVYLYFDLEGFDCTARVNARTTARPGDEVVMAMDLTKLHIFDKDTEKVITN